MKAKTSREFVELNEKFLGTGNIYHVDADEDVWHEIVLNYPDLRRTVARNKKIPESIIRLLANDESSEVRYGIAQKRATPHDVLLKLAHDPDETVRHRVAVNRKSTRDIILTMVNDPWETIRESVCKRLAEMDEKAKQNSKK